MYSYLCQKRGVCKIIWKWIPVGLFTWFLVFWKKMFCAYCSTQLGIVLSWEDCDFVMLYESFGIGTFGY